MSKLAGIAIILGTVIAIIHAPCVFVPDRVRVLIKRFPRSRWTGWILTAGDLVWVVWIVLNAPLGRFEHLKPLLYVLAPVVFFLIVNLMDELLAPRALGGLLLLMWAPLLAAARWHESGLRLVIVVLAYVLVVKGIILVLSPYQFRKAMAFWTRNNKLCMAGGAIGLGFGIFIIFLGLAVY